MPCWCSTQSTAKAASSRRPPRHPLASAPEPIKAEEMLKHRAVAAADSTRNLPPRTVGLIGGQEVLTVANVRAKLQAQVLGLGAGNLPRYLAEPEVKAGRLVIKQTEEPRQESPLYVAWRTAHRGKALQWFLKRLQQPKALEELLAE